MGLAILSNKIEKPETVFANVALAALRAKLFLLFTEWAYTDDNRIELNIQKFAGEENKESFLIDIISEDEQMSNNTSGLLPINYNSDDMYMIAGTNNVPSRLSYDFSLEYLNINPNHLISIYDEIFTRKDIEEIQKESGFYDEWYNKK